MIHSLTISNKTVYIDDIPIKDFLHLWYKSTAEKDLEVYTIQNVVFCEITGNINIYKNKNEYKLQFISFNAVTIYNIQNIPSDFKYKLNKLKYILASKYRVIDDNYYYNKRFEFRLIYTINNVSVLITQRHIKE